MNMLRWSTRKIYDVCILSLPMTNSGVAALLLEPEPSTHDSKLSNNLDTDCVRVLAIRTPNNAQYLPHKIR